MGEYYRYVSTHDKEVKSLDSVQAEFAPSAADLITEFLFSETRFNIDSVRVVGDSARVYIASSSPSLSYVMQQAQIVERDLGSETDILMKLSILSERYKLAGFPRDENLAIYRLIREKEGWRVVVGWTNQEAASSKQQAASSK